MFFLNSRKWLHVICDMHHLCFRSIVNQNFMNWKSLVDIMIAEFPVRQQIWHTLFYLVQMIDLSTVEPETGSDQLLGHDQPGTNQWYYLQVTSGHNESLVCRLFTWWTHTVVPVANIISVMILHWNCWWYWCYEMQY